MIRKIGINQNNKLKNKLDVVFDCFVILGAESKAPLCLGGPLEAGHSDRKWETRFAAFTFHARRAQSCLRDVRFAIRPKRSMGHLLGVKKINFLMSRY